FSVFLFSAIEQAMPSNAYWSSSALSSLAGGMASNIQPIFLQRTILAFSRTLLADPLVWNAAIVASFLIISALWIRSRRIAALVTATVSLFIWVFFQDFGIIGGYGTDPNIALPVMLISIALVLYLKPTVERTGSQSKEKCDLRDVTGIRQ
ncbi:MAG: hypothetical protein M1468_03295, partial [Candidatus Thermoplasmatota archaeon]|nr:hypothetical protein [Candidatus Thermoplasmatota archaeon]